MFYCSDRPELLDLCSVRHPLVVYLKFCGLGQICDSVGGGRIWKFKLGLSMSIDAIAVQL